MELDDDEEELEYKRASEWAFEHFTHIPTVGESFTYDFVTITVASMKQNRIKLLRLTVDDEKIGGDDE